MTRAPKTLRPDQTLLEAMRFLRDHHVRHIPVVDAYGHLEGVVTDRDIKRATPSALIDDQRDVCVAAELRGTNVVRDALRSALVPHPVGEHAAT
jgi:acetoin utilization protein AcuB